MIKFILELVLLVVFIGISGCREPVGGGVGYQYLGSLDSIKFATQSDGSCITTVRVEDNSFVVKGKIEFHRWNCVYVWINQDKDTLRLRRQSITSEHPILSWSTLDWRKNK